MPNPTLPRPTPRWSTQRGRYEPSVPSVRAHLLVVGAPPLAERLRGRDPSHCQIIPGHPEQALEQVRVASHMASTPVVQVPVYVLIVGGEGGGCSTACLVGCLSNYLVILPPCCFFPLLAGLVLGLEVPMPAREEEAFGLGIPEPFHERLHPRILEISYGSSPSSISGSVTGTSFFAQSRMCSASQCLSLFQSGGKDNPFFRLKSYLIA